MIDPVEIKQPRVGDIVLYFHPKNGQPYLISDASKKNGLAAIVVSFPENSDPGMIVNLNAFALYDGTILPYSDVPFSDKPSPGTWTWRPE